MKKFTMLSSVLASALMLTIASCSSEDVAGDDAQIGKGTTSFLAVNIENVGSAPASRSYNQGNGTYEDGSEAESKINNVRFYFFNGDGTPYLLVNDDPEKTPVNFLEREIETDDMNGNDHDHTAEITTKAMLVLKGETKAVPASVIAVINPAALDNSTLHSGTMTLSELRTSATGSKFNDKTEGFVMSNSVYESAGQDVCSTPVANSVFATSEEALKKPVDIYVERVNAKVNAKIDATYIRDGETTPAWTNNEGKYQIKVGSIDVTTYDENTNATPTIDTYPVYAVVQGWQLADANGKAELCKQINTSWYAGELGISPWTTSDYHRCFWSKSVPFTSGAQGGVNHPVNPTFNGITQSLTDEFSADPVYTLPNTPDVVVANPKTSVNTLTKLIVAAKLVYKDKNNTYHPAQVCQYRGLTYLGEDAVKKQIVSSFGQYFKKTTTESGDVYKSIEASDIAFKTVVPGSPESSEVKNYEVVATLASTVGELYVKDGETTYKPVKKDVVNAELEKEEAQVRPDGFTYYYTPIQHLGEAGKLGEYGIVRNHSYQVTIQNIQGYGTPVYDPDKVIDPMIPSDDNTYLAARINVLSWRVVSSNVDLDQTK